MLQSNAALLHKISTLSQTYFLNETFFYSNSDSTPFDHHCDCVDPGRNGVDATLDEQRRAENWSVSHFIFSVADRLFVCSGGFTLALW